MKRVHNLPSSYAIMKQNDALYESSKRDLNVNLNLNKANFNRVDINEKKKESNRRVSKRMKERGKEMVFSR